MLRHRRHFLVQGRSERWIREAHERGELIRLHRGWYASRERWDQLQHDWQHVLKLLAVERSSLGSPVFSHGSAAVLLGLPVMRAATQRVHLTQEGGRAAGTSRAALWHRGPLADDDLDDTCGVRHTSETRTVIDVARSQAFESGIMCVDAALHRRSGGGWIAVNEFRGRLRQCLEALPRSAGYRRACRVLRFASAQSESPLESLGRLQFERLGFEVRQQVGVPGPHGQTYRLDLELIGHRTFIELDGRQKYSDDSMRRGRSLESLILAEKKREDWVRGRSDARLLRGGWGDVQTVEAADRFLREFGITPPGPVGGLPRMELH